MGTSWNTTRAAMALRSLTGVALVTGQFTEYLRCFLYSLALTDGVDVATLELTERAGDASFHLAELWTQLLEDKKREVRLGKMRTAKATAMDTDDDRSGDDDDGGGGRLP